MEIKKIFVIVVAFNGKLWYDKCLNSLRNSKKLIQTIVIDNGSSDDSVAYIRSNFPEVHLIKSDVNLGFGQANNLGIRYAMDHGADYVFLLNQDAWIEPNTISGLIDIHKLNENYGILSPLHLNADKTSIEFGLMHYIADYKITSTNLINDLYFSRLGVVYETQYINAAAWLLPRKTLEIVGGFDPIFYHYGEDDNYMQRVRYCGFKIGICPSLIICHDTENQLIRNEQTQQTVRKNLLVELTDINRGESINASIFYSFKNAFFKALKLNFGLAKYFILNGFYIAKMKNRILDSKMQNRKKGSWL